MKEQIEEMTKDLCDIECKGMKCNECDRYGCEYRMLAEALYNTGYRKQKEGEWNINGTNGNLIGNWRCSACNGVSLKDSDFCPNCGAKMKGEQTKKEHFSPEEVRNMTPKEVRENLAAIMKSMREWK